MEQKTLFGHHLGVEGPMKLSAPSIAVLLVLSLSGAVLYGAEQARAVPAPLPIVMWHGMGDSCCASYSLGAVKDFLQEVLDGMPLILVWLSGSQAALRIAGHKSCHTAGVYVLSISTGSGGADDTYSGFFGNVNDQARCPPDEHCNTNVSERLYCLWPVTLSLCSHEDAVAPPAGTRGLSAAGK